MYRHILTVLALTISLFFGGGGASQASASVIRIQNFETGDTTGMEVFGDDVVDVRRRALREDGSIVRAPRGDFMGFLRPQATNARHPSRTSGFRVTLPGDVQPGDTLRFLWNVLPYAGDADTFAVSFIGFDTIAEILHVSSDDPDLGTWQILEYFIPFPPIVVGRFSAANSDPATLIFEMTNWGDGRSKALIDGIVGIRRPVSEPGSGLLVFTIGLIFLSLARRGKGRETS